MKKLIALVLILALPTIALGATGIAVTSGGLASLSYVQGTAPATIPIELVISTDIAGTGINGIWAADGGLLGPAGTSATAITYKTGWAVIGSYPLPAPLTGDLGGSWGGMDGDANFGNAISASGGTVATLTVSGISALPVGEYTIQVTDAAGNPISTPPGVGYYMAGDSGSPVAFDSSTALRVSITPEPATMLLLAAALPFLRRRSA